MVWQRLKRLFGGVQERPREPRLIIYHPVMAERKKVLVQIQVKRVYSGVYRVGRGRTAGEVEKGFNVETNPHTQAIAENHWQFQTDYEGRCWLKDLGTDQGTKVNGALREGAALKHGDIITSGVEEAEPKVAVVFDEYGDLEGKLSTPGAISAYLKSRLGGKK